MQHTIKIFTLLLLSVACVDTPDHTLELDTELEPRGLGTTWAPCDASEWGCVGSGLGFGDACLRPVSDEPLSICVPQTWDPDVDDDCGDVSAPFGLGVRLKGSAYCVPDCMTDDDCGPGLACSPSSHYCAWQL